MAWINFFNKKFFGTLLAAGFFILVFQAGYQVAQKSWGGRLFVSTHPLSPKRGIASVKKDTLRSGEHKANRYHMALIRDARVQSTPDTVNIHLGSFLVPSPEGRKLPVCDLYDMLDMEFMAMGLAIHGHVPKLVIKARCTLNSKRQIGPFAVPKKKILDSSVRQALFSTAHMTLLFFHVSMSWPYEWLMTRVRFIDQKTGKDITVTLPSKTPEESVVLEF